LVTKMTHADGKYQKFGYSQFGNKMWQDNELFQRTNYSYDNYNRLRIATDPMSHSTTYDYSPTAGNTTQCYLHTTNSAYFVTSGAGIKTHNTYDPNFLKLTSTAAYGILNLTTTFEYDNVGNLTWVTDPLNHKTKNIYDNRNRKTNATEAYGTTVAATTVWHYDGANNVNRIDRADGTHEWRGFDGLNRMAWTFVVRQVPGGDPQQTENVSTWFGYNPSGTLQGVMDSNLQITLFEYDASDRRKKMTYPGNSQFQSWNYDNAGNLASRTSVGGSTQSFTYDNRNRKIGMSWSPVGDSANFTYYDDGRLHTATNPNSTVTRTYYADGRLQHDNQAVVGGPAKEANYVYDGDGNVTWMNVDPYDNPAYTWDFSYDGLGRLDTISPHGGSTAFKYQYDTASNVTHRYTYLPNSVTVDQQTPRDSLNRMAGRWLKKNGTVFAAQMYTYDHMNRLQEVIWGSVKDVFGYYRNGELYWCEYGVPTNSPYQGDPDTLDPDTDTTDSVDPFSGYQPPETVEPEPAAPPPSTTNNSPPTVAVPTTANFQRWVGYYLDKAGNRMVVGDTVNGNTTYAPNSLNQYTGSAGGAAITNGNQHEVGSYNGVGYTYINDERLSSVKIPPTNPTTTYNLYYDALGRCVKRTLGSVTTYYIYDGEKPILDYKSSDLSHPAKNVYGKGIDEILMRTDPTVNSGQPFYYGQDHEGSVTHLINASGNIIEQYQYDAFGALTHIYDANFNSLDHTAYNNRFLFTGREYAATYQKTYVSAFNFYEYRARAYNPTLGRFMSEDPKLFDAGDYNLFRYCHNDPIDFSDPMGLDTLVVVGDQRDDSYNIFGHASMGMTGQGVFSYGTQKGDWGISAKNFVARESDHREQRAFIIHSSAKEEAAMRQSLEGSKNKPLPDALKHPIKAYCDNCATRVRDALQAGGHDVGKVNTPNQLANALEKQAKDGNVEKIGVPARSSSVPEQVKEFEPGAQSQRNFNLEQAIEKGIQDALEHSSDLIHSKPDPFPR
jgi:RHS repeat-associated protein